MAQIKDLVPNYTDLLAKGVSKEELISLAKQRAKQKSAVQTVKPQENSIKNYLKTDSGFIPQVARGLAKNFIDTAEILKGATGIEVPKYNQLVNLGTQLDKTKEAISSQNLTPKRVEEKKKMAEQTQKAEGTWQNVKAAAGQLGDAITHPKEWTAQGVTEMASSPFNAVPLGVGGVVAKDIASPLLRAFIGGTAGAGENSLLNGGLSYAQARGMGKSADEANKIALQGAAAGALIGGTLGSVGGAIAKPKVKEKTPIETPSNDPLKSDQTSFNFDKSANKDNVFVVDPTTGKTVLDNHLKIADTATQEKMNSMVEAEIKATKEDAQNKAIVQDMTQKGTTDPKLIENQINKNTIVSDIDQEITNVINDGQILPPAYTGPNILIKLQNSVKSAQDNPQSMRSPDEIYGKLRSVGASDELARVAAASYEQKDINIFYDWYGQKLKDSILKDRAKMLEDLSKQSKEKSKPKTDAKVLKNGKIIDDVTGVNAPVNYKVLPFDQVNTNFKSGDGYQFRSNKQDKVIKDIQNNFDPERHFGSHGSFDGLPVVDNKGNVIVGNHRAEAIKNMTPEQKANYQKSLNHYYPQNKDTGMLVRQLKDNNNAVQIAKVSNDRRVKADSEKLILQEAKYAPALKNLPDKIESEAELKGHLKADDELASNQATLAYVGSPELPYSIDRYMKDNKNDLNFKQMFYKNAYKLYNITKEAEKTKDNSLNVAPLLARAIDKITVSKANKKANLDDIIAHYNETLKLGGKDIEGNPISPDDFSADILGIALKHYRTLKDDGIVEFGKRIDSVEKYVQEAKQPSLFADAYQPTRSDVAMRFLNETDRSRLDLQQLKQRIDEYENTRTGDGGDNSGTKGAVDRKTETNNAGDGISSKNDRSVSANSTKAVRSDATNAKSDRGTDVSPSTREPPDTTKLAKHTGSTGDQLSVGPLDNLKNDITYDEAYAAHRGTSFDPEKRAKQRIDGYVETLKDDYATLKAHVKDDPAKQALLDARFADYRQKMKTLYNDLLAKESRTMSSMITGPANFPTATNRKRMSYADNARNKFLDTREKWMKRMRRELNPAEKGPSTLGEYKAKLEAQLKSHEAMKEANKIIRNAKLDKKAKIEGLIKLGFSKEELKQVEPEGFPPYSLANSNGRIKNTRERIAELQRLKTREAEGKASEMLYEGANIKENIPDKRVQIFFDEKPSAEIRAILKKRGFKWSPKNKAWQRILTRDGLRAAKEIMDDNFKSKFDEVTKKILEC